MARDKKRLVEGEEEEEDELEVDKAYKAASCIRKVANISHVKPTMLMDTKMFNPDLLKAVMSKAAPKLHQLFKKIRELDAKDMKTHKKHFKHMIFTDIDTSNYGAKLIASAFVAHGFTPAFTQSAHVLKPDDKLLETKGSNFGLLISKKFGPKSMNAKSKKAMMHKFNERPANTHGQLMRFIILDQGFKEGIDLFDVKYIHLFEPLVSNADQKQAIGRGTRFCGQQGLTFHPRFGWPLYVFRYDVRLPKEIQGANTLFELFVKYSNIDLRKVVFAAELEQVVVEAAVDRALTQEIHSFSIDTPPPIITPKRGGAVKGNKIVMEAPHKVMGLRDMQCFIDKSYGKFHYPKAKLENMCKAKDDALGKGGKLVFTPTQDFVRHYFTPASAYKGILLYHSVGTGKTCTAIATATSTFEREGYTILWVTRHTLKADIWKNMYEQVCHTVLQEDVDAGKVKLPKKMTNPMKYLSDKWIQPISYKQFSNMLLKNNKYYEAIVKRNGEADPLRKTLVIIDEAHKLYAPNVAANEKADTEILEEMIQISYKVSGKDSVRVMLMTATPYTEDSMEMIKLLNNLRPAREAFPTSFDDFAKLYLNKQGYFTEKGKVKFQDEISGYVSYINRSQDARNFAHPILEHVMVDMSLAGKEAPSKHNDVLIKEKTEVMKGLRKDIQHQRASYKFILRDTKAKNKARIREAYHQCTENVKDYYADAKDEVMGRKERRLSDCKGAGRGNVKGCRESVMADHKLSMERLKIMKATEMANCREEKKRTKVNPGNDENVAAAGDALNKLLDDVERLKNEREEIKSKLRGVRERNKDRTEELLGLREEAKDLRAEKKELMAEIKKVATKLKAAKDDKTKAKLAAELSGLREENEEYADVLAELRANVTKLNTSKKLAQVEIGRGSLGDISQETALYKKCL